MGGRKYHARQEQSAQKGNNIGMHRVFFTTCLLAWTASFNILRAEDPPQAAAGVRDLAGAPARLVWCQDAGDGSDAGAQGNNLRLMGFDTEDGLGERCILAGPSNFSRPIITPDGRKVIFSNRREQKIYAVNFDGSGLQELAAGVALAAWRDRATETDWIYAGKENSRSDYFNSAITAVRRFRLDKPEVAGNVWGKTPVNLDNFQLSADGRCAGALFPWPTAGLAALPDGEWKKIGDGCWPSLAPDNSLLMWIFDGAHRNLTMFRTGTGERWTINIASLPGIDGYEVYHPRWSSHPRFMVMTGPYKVGESSNRIRGGGREVEIYLGRFSADHGKIEKWARVTRNGHADFFPDAWIAAAEHAGADAAGASSAAVTDSAASQGAWPVSFEGLYYFWQNRSRANSFTDPAGGLTVACRAEARGRAKFGRNFEMMPSGGAFVADGGAGTLIEKCAASGQLSVEALLTPRGNNTGNTNILPIAGFPAPGGRWNFLLGQRGGRLVFLMRTDAGGEGRILDLCPMPESRPGHVIVSCSTSSAACYLDGAQVFAADSVTGGSWSYADPARPRYGALVFGNRLLQEYPLAPGGNAPAWKGALENVAVYARWIGPAEAAKKFKALASGMAKRANLQALSVRAVLLSEPAAPAPSSIAPYRRALLAGHYRVEETVEGKSPGSEILAARWAIMDGALLPPRPGAAPGAQALRLELYSDHPELEGERLIMESTRYDLPLYYILDD